VSFLEPLFLIGLLAAGLPIVVHMMNRRKAVKVAFPAMRLLHESNKRTARSIKLRQLLLMAARILGVLLLVLALSKPFFLSEEGLAEDERMPTAAVIVLDDSASMQHAGWWSDAQDEAEEMAARTRPWDELAYLLTTREDVGSERLSDRHEEVRTQLAARQVSDLKGDMRARLQGAAAMLKTSQLPQRKIVVITDTAGMQELVKTDLDAKLGARVQWVDVRGRSASGEVENLAVTRVNYEQDGSEATSWRIVASVKNYGPSPQRNIEVRLVLDGEVLSAGRIATLAAGEEIEQVFSHRQSTQISAPARVEIVSKDRYPLDDTYHFVFRTRARINALLVNGETSSVVDEDEMFFLSRALNPGRSTTEGIIPRVITPEGLLGEDMSKYDAVIFANVPRISAALATRLGRYVEEGGGVMFFAGDQIDAEAYNATLEDLLPKRLRGIKELAQRGDPDAPVKITRPGVADARHPIFRAFSLPGGETLQSAEVYSYLLFDPTPTQDSRQVLAFKDNAPALLERQVGKGRVLFFATSADIEWTTLPIRSAYVPFTQRAVQYLARRSSNVGEKGLRAGEPVRLEVGGLIKERVVVRGPLGDQKERFVLEPEDGLVTVTPTYAGVYEVWADSDDPEQGTELVDVHFAVNVPQAESNLGGVSPEKMKAWLSRQEEEQQEDGSQPGLATREKRVNIWPTLLFLFTLLLLAETILGTRRSLLNKVTGKES
jgi:hypothetical protein